MAYMRVSIFSAQQYMRLRTRGLLFARELIPASRSLKWKSYRLSCQALAHEEFTISSPTFRVVDYVVVQARSGGDDGEM